MTEDMDEIKNMLNSMVLGVMEKEKAEMKTTLVVDLLGISYECKKKPTEVAKDFVIIYNILRNQ